MTELAFCLSWGKVHGCLVLVGTAEMGEWQWGTVSIHGANVCGCDGEKGEEADVMLVCVRAVVGTMGGVNATSQVLLCTGLARREGRLCEWSRRAGSVADCGPKGDSGGGRR